MIDHLIGWIDWIDWSFDG